MRPTVGLARASGQASRHRGHQRCHDHGHAGVPPGSAALPHGEAGYRLSTRTLVGGSNCHCVEAWQKGRVVTREALLVPVGLFLAALALRVVFVWARPIVDEPLHYLVARELWHFKWAAFDIDGFPKPSPEWFFWQRPMFALAYWPSAQFGFTAFRIESVVMGSLIPPLVWLLLDSIGTSRPWRLGASFFVLVEPPMVIWSAYVLPDALATCFVLGGLLALSRTRFKSGALLLAFGAWSKEVAIFVPIALTLISLVGTLPTAWLPTSWSRYKRATFWAGVTVVSTMPLLFSLSFPGALLPGWLKGGDTSDALQHIVVLPWLLVPILWGLSNAKSRFWSVLALGLWSFFAFYHIVLGKHVSWHYVVLPGTLAVLAAAQGLETKLTTANGPRRRGFVAGALALLVVCQVALPSTNSMNRVASAPILGHGVMDLRESYAFDVPSDHGLSLLLERTAQSYSAPLVLDVHWSFDIFQLVNVFPKARTESTLFAAPTLSKVLSKFQENETDLLILGADNAGPLNTELRVYGAACVVDVQREYVAIDGPCLVRTNTRQ